MWGTAAISAALKILLLITGIHCVLESTLPHATSPAH